MCQLKTAMTIKKAIKKRSKEIIQKKKAKKIKNINSTRSKRENSNITIAIFEKLLI